jgi:protein phosphatase/serine/threonine-protein phosphatase Stp1
MSGLTAPAGRDTRYYPGAVRVSSGLGWELGALKTKSWALSDPGTVRKVNQDNLLCRPDIGLWVVADGAGGHASGAAASAMIVDHLNRLTGGMPFATLVERVREVLQGTHAQLRADALELGGEAVIASTFVALILRGDQFVCLWAGDSRLYLLRQNQLLQMTKDHSLVQELIDLGKLTAADAELHPHANVITRAVGADSQRLEIDQVSGMAAPGDRFLLCSDGISKTLEPGEISALLRTAGAASPPQLLIDAARARKVRDNATAIVVDIPPAGVTDADA